MTNRPGAHVDLATAKQYAEQAVDSAAEVVIEQHLLVCSGCRQLIAVAAGHGALTGVSPARVGSVWAAVEASIEVSTPTEKSQRFQTMRHRVRTGWSWHRSMFSITGVRLQVVATAALVVTVVGGSAIALRGLNDAGLLARPQSQPVTSVAQSTTPQPAVSPQLLVPAQSYGYITHSIEAPASWTPTFLPNEYIAVVWMGPWGPEAHQRAEAVLQQFPNLATLRSTDFPDLLMPDSSQPPDSLIVYAGPFTGSQDASVYCGSLIASAPIIQCTPVQPSPNG